jgi:hypothetical protein
LRGDGSGRATAVAITNAIRMKEARNPPTMVIQTRFKLLRPRFVRGLDPSPMTGNMARFAITPKKIEQALMPISLGLRVR